MQTHPPALKQDGSRADAGLLSEKTARSLQQPGGYDEKEETRQEEEQQRVARSQEEAEGCRQPDQQDALRPADSLAGGYNCRG